MKINFVPPKIAMIEHILYDKSIIKVQCEVSSYDEDDNLFWMEYIDPEDDECCIMDLVEESELEFMADNNDN